MKAPSSDAVAAQAHALADRLRALPESRWLRVEDGSSVAARGLAIAQAMADLVAGSGSRPVPDLGPFAVPDQLAVTATDLAGSTVPLDPATLQQVADRIAELAALTPKAMAPPP